MIKLAALAFLPALAATYYTHHDLPSANPRTWVGVEEQDRQFLVALDQRQPNSNPMGSVAGADRAFLADLEFDDRLAMSRAQKELPVLRAIPVEHPAAVPVARVVNSAGTPASPSGGAPEIRRAVPVVATAAATPASPTNLRDAFHESFVSMIEPEVRRATAVDQRRASIVITGAEVIVRP
jgi:hypothetical protein